MRLPAFLRHSNPNSRDARRGLRVESLESRLMLHGGGDDLLPIVGEAEAPSMPDFSLVDVNQTSATANQDVSPRDYLQQTSGWYYGGAL